MGKRLIAWFMYGIVFGLIPLIASALIHFLAGKFSSDVFTRSPELLFFSLMVSATVLGDANELGKATTGDLAIPLLRAGLTIAVIMSAILYGAFMFAEIESKVDEAFVRRVFLLSLVLAILSGLVSTLGEVLIGRIESQKND